MSAVAEASPSIRARDNLSALGLHEMAAALPDYVRMVAAGERDFCSALEEMTRVEVAAREARIVRQRIRSSGFPYVKGLADFDWDFQPSVPRARVEELATLRFIERAENVLLVGSPGVGKTHLAVAIGIEAVRAGREVRFMDCARLVEDLQDAQARGILKKRLKYYAHSKLLVLMSIRLSPIPPTQSRRSRQRIPAVSADVRRRFRRPGPARGPSCDRTSR